MMADIFWFAWQVFVYLLVKRKDLQTIFWFTMFCFLIYKYFKIVELFVIMEVPEEISMYIKQITTQY